MNTLFLLKHWQRWTRTAIVCICFIFTEKALAAAPARTNSTTLFIEAVSRFADQVLTHGRDVYGKPTPLFVDGLDVDTREPVKWKWADGKEWVLCDLANQQGLFRTLDGLSGLTGNPKYIAVEATHCF